MKAEIITDLK